MTSILVIQLLLGDDSTLPMTAANRPGSNNTATNSNDKSYHMLHNIQNDKVDEEVLTMGDSPVQKEIVVVGEETNNDVHNDKTKQKVQDEEDFNSKRKVLNILQKAGVKITPELESKIPTWGDIVSQYGSEPKMIGLETCSRFQTVVPKTEAYIGLAGMFDTGTNLLADSLHAYCELPKRKAPEHNRAIRLKEYFGMKKGMVSLLHKTPKGYKLLQQRERRSLKFSNTIHYIAMECTMGKA